MLFCQKTGNNIKTGKKRQKKAYLLDLIGRQTAKNAKK
jgi:hypothetical protein